MGTFKDYFDRRYDEYTAGMQAADASGQLAGQAAQGGGAAAATPGKPMWGPSPTKASPHSLAMELGVPVARVIQTLTAMGVKSKKGTIDPASTMPPQIADKVRAQLDQRRVQTGPVGPAGVNWQG